jgi:hypothetical protein
MRRGVILSVNKQLFRADRAVRANFYTGSAVCAFGFVNIIEALRVDADCAFGTFGFTSAALNTFVFRNYVSHHLLLDNNQTISVFFYRVCRILQIANESQLLRVVDCHQIVRINVLIHNLIELPFMGGSRKTVLTLTTHQPGL